MMRQTAQKSIAALLTSPTATLPPAFLLPSRARFFNSTAQIVEPSVDTPPPEALPIRRTLFTPAVKTAPASPKKGSATAKKAPSTRKAPFTKKAVAQTAKVHAVARNKKSSVATDVTSDPPAAEKAHTSTKSIPAPLEPSEPPKRPRNIPPPPPTPLSSPLQLSESTRELLPLLYHQAPHYIRTHIHAFPYLVTAGDTLRLPFLMPGVQTGDVLRLNRASVLGSRDFTLKGAPYIDERLFEVRARVMGVESEPLRIKEKTKRRQRKVKRVKSKHRFTVLKIAEVRVKSLEEIEKS